MKEYLQSAHHIYARGFINHGMNLIITPFSSHKGEGQRNKEVRARLLRAFTSSLFVLYPTFSDLPSALASSRVAFLRPTRSYVTWGASNSSATQFLRLYHGMFPWRITTLPRWFSLPSEAQSELAKVEWRGYMELMMFLKIMM
jgi:hypothetical protein